MDIVARELGLYNVSPCFAADAASQLPGKGEGYYLLVRETQLAELSGQIGSSKTVGGGNWVVHKTGTFPRLLRLAKGTEPLEDILIVQVESARQN